MRIVFGWNHFRIKSYAPHELGLPASKEQQYQIEVLQQYFHLFWIPFFSLGQKWAVRKGSGLYELPLEYQSYIKTQGVKTKTPWYTFSGPLLILLGVVIWTISDSIREANQRLASKNYFNRQIEKLDGRYRATAKSDYYLLHPQKGADKLVLLQVAEVKPQEIVFRKLVTGLNEYELSPRKIESLFTMVPGTDTITITREQLNKAVKRDFEHQYQGTDLLGDGSEYIVQDIYKLNGPLLTDRGTGGLTGSGRLTLELMNKGWPGTLVSIENKAGNIQWNNELPMEIASATSDYDDEGRILLSGENYKRNSPYEFEIVMKDSLAKEHRYNIKGNYMDKTITQLY